MTDERDLRPDPQMEGRVSSWLTETDLTAAEADQGFDRLMDDFPVTPQARRRFLGRWFERDEGTRRRADDHDHLPDSRRTRLMFSATGLVAAFAVLALAVNVVPTDTSPPGAGTGSTLSVAADGSGDYSTIAEAVAAATDGDTIMVGPGTYTEAIVIDKDITLMGDGPREEVVIVAPEDGPTFRLISAEQDPYALHISDGEATVADMTFRGQPSEVIISGGSPTLQGLVLEDVGAAYGGGSSFGGSSIVVQGPEATATILDNELLRGGPIALFGDAVATIKENVLSDGPHLFIQGHGAGTEIVGNTVNGTLRFGLNVHLREPLTVAGNSFSPGGGSSSVGIRIRSSQEIAAEGTFVVEDNIVDGGSGGGTGIQVASGDGVEVRGNTVTNTQSGVIWARGDGTLEDNTTTDNAAGITILAGSPVLAGNMSCDNTASNLSVTGSATPEIGENDFCLEPVSD